MLAGLRDEDLVEREKNIQDNKDAILYSKRYSDEEYEYRYLFFPCSVHGKSHSCYFIDM